MVSRHFGPSINIISHDAFLTFLFSKFLTFFSTTAMAAWMEVSVTEEAPFSWGLLTTEGMIKLATLVWMTKIQLLIHGVRLVRLSMRRLNYLQL